MNTQELKGERVRQGKSTEYMGKLIGKTTDAYAKKERGEVKFTPEEQVVLAKDLKLSFEMFNAIFYDGKLPFSKSECKMCTLVT